MDSKEQALAIADALEDKLASDIRVYDVSAISNLADFQIAATGTSSPHLKALGADLEKRLKERGLTGVRCCGTPDSGWMVLDAFDVIVHLFTRETRDYYRIEELWEGAPVVERPQQAE